MRRPWRNGAPRRGGYHLAWLGRGRVAGVQLRRSSAWLRAAMAPQVLVLIGFFVIPVIFIAEASLRNKAGTLTGANYAAFLFDSYDRAVVGRTLGVAFGTTLLTLI